jgi:hypothetical protein
LVLKKQGLPVHLSHRFNKRHINIAFGRTLQKLWKRPDVFVVDVKADVPRDYWGRNLQIVQNEAAEDPGKKKFYIPHWPQPGLIKRDPLRTDVKNVAYAGRLNNLLLGKTNLSEIINRLGLRFINLNQRNWNDFSNMDICIGIRSFDTNTYKNKPATKLYNSWHAQVPFIGGYESAFEQTGIPGENYLRVKNIDEMVDALNKLRDNRDFYNFLVENGNKAKVKYDLNSIAKKWVDFLENIAVPQYAKWKCQRLSLRTYSLASNIAVSIAQDLYRIPQSLPNRIRHSIKKRLTVDK